MPRRPRNVFTKMIEREVHSGGYPRKARASIKWLLRKAREAKQRRIGTSKLRNMNEQVLLRKLKTPESLKSQIMLGHMFMFTYEPKGKDTLEYYDEFPLVFPIDDYSDGFLGINMHYLDPRDRARLMDGLYDTVSDENYDEKTKLKLTYEILKGVSKYSYFRPCIKRYLNSNVKSQFLKVESAEWDNVLFLPTERFKKANRRKVWDNSKKEITTNATKNIT